MKIILKADVKGVGRKYEIKEVSDGHANNLLLPRKLAEFASPEAVRRAEILKAATAAELEIREKLTEAQIETLKGVKVVLSRRANEKGNLFEKIHPNEISAAIREQYKIEMAPENIIIKEPIKEVGDHVVAVEVGKSKGAFQVLVRAD